jgi:hypothetical protein
MITFAKYTFAMCSVHDLQKDLSVRVLLCCLIQLIGHLGSTHARIVAKTLRHTRMDHTQTQEVTGSSPTCGQSCGRHEDMRDWSLAVAAINSGHDCDAPTVRQFLHVAGDEIESRPPRPLSPAGDAADEEYAFAECLPGKAT